MKIFIHVKKDIEMNENILLLSLNFVKNNHFNQLFYT